MMATVLTDYVDVARLLFSLTILAVSLVLFTSWRRPANFPPGPRGWPILGSLLAIRKGKPHAVMGELSKQYGDVFSLKLGQRLVVVLNGSHALREALVKKADYFSGRPTHTVNSKYSGGRGLIYGQYTDDWKILIRFTVATLKNFGMGKSMLEEKILKEVRYLMDEIDSSNGQPIDLSLLLKNAISNIICSLLFGERRQYGDARFQELLRLFDHYFEIVGSANITNYFPFLSILPQYNVLGDIHGIYDTFRNWVQPVIDEHIQRLDIKFTPTDFVDAYLAEMKSHELKGTHTPVNEENLSRTMADLFTASTDTVTMTLRWVILYLVLNPEMQNKMHVEIDNIIVQDGDISLADKHNLPYTEAFILEVARVASVAPLAVPHATTDDVTLMGYAIPKGTTVIANLWSAHMDDNTWKEPDLFNPERFLQDGKVVNADSIIPFSLGRRSCPGKELANMEIFLVLTTLLQHYEFSLPEGMAPPTTEGRAGFTVAPVRYKVCVVRR